MTRGTFYLAHLSVGSTSVADLGVLSVCLLYSFGMPSVAFLFVLRHFAAHLQP